MNVTLLRRLIYFCPLPILLGSLLLGPSASAEAGEILAWLWGLVFGEGTAGREESLVGTIVWEVRMPRILLTFLVGGALAAAGNALQALFRNPLVAPYILGLSSGAAFGAALALTLPLLPVQPTAFGFALLAVGLAYFLARTRKTVSVVSLILSGGDRHRHLHRPADHRPVPQRPVQAADHRPLDHGQPAQLELGQAALGGPGGDRRRRLALPVPAGA